MSGSCYDIVTPLAVSATGKLTVVLPYRLRQVDVKAEHFERQVSRIEQERDDWERKHGVSKLFSSKWRSRSSSMDLHLTCDFQEAVEKYQQSKRELDEVVAQMESLVSLSCLSCPVHAHPRNSERWDAYISVTSILHILALTRFS